MILPQSDYIQQTHTEHSLYIKHYTDKNFYIKVSQKTSAFPRKKLQGKGNQFYLCPLQI